MRYVRRHACLHICLQPSRGCWGSLWVLEIDEWGPVDEGPGKNASSLGLEPAHLAFLRDSQEGKKANNTRNGQCHCSGCDGAFLQPL